LSAEEERRDEREAGARPEVPLWPVWGFSDGHSLLARYVTPGAILADTELKARLTLDEQHLEPEEQDRIRAERLYERLREERLSYDRQPWASAEGVQQVRHPWWLLDERFGNCLDLTLLYAGMCLATGTGVLLALAPEKRHALALITPGRLHFEGALSELCVPEGFRAAEGDPGVVEGRGTALRDAIEGGEVVAVDLVELTGGNDFEGAKAAAAADWGPDVKIHLVDVPYLQAIPPGDPVGDFSELPHPVSFRPSIRQRVPSGGGEFRPFPVHERMLGELRDLDGMHALIGDGGRGKSTIARRLAERAKDGAAWFLDASDPAALSGSLAEAMLAEKPPAAHGSGDELAERRDMAETARAHLATATRPWLVVLDNADGDPATLRGLLPTPKAGQAILVTTINREWADVAGFVPHVLRGVEPADLGRLGESADVAGLIGGRPLLLEAFERLAANSSWDGRELPSPLPAVEQELAGPAAFWALLQRVERLGDEARHVAAVAAHLPAGGQPAALLRRLVPGSEGAIDRFVELGLLARDRNADEVRLHRLFGEAIRLDLEASAPGLCDRVARALAADPGAVALLDERGDLATVNRLDERLAAIDKATAEPDQDLGLSLHGAGSLLELHGHTESSGDTFKLAERHLDDEPVLRADCLLGRARTVNQHHKEERELLEKAIEWARDARELKLASKDPKAEGPAYRALAMEGLLMRPLADFAEPGEARDKVLDEAQEILEEADRRRQALPDDVVPPAEKARSRYNLAGVRVPKAKGSPARAGEHLAAAQRIYEDVAEWRSRIYDRMVHPHIAACVNGVAIVAYYRAMLLPAGDARRTELLRVATARAGEALGQRAQLDGPVDLKEAAKSASLLAKIALARTTMPPKKSRKDAGKVAAEAMDELEQRDLLPLPVPPLPRGADGLLDAIDEWARSQALREVVGAFGEPPPEDLDLASLLAWLDDFSDRWDSRSGERDIGEEPTLPLQTRKQVERSAAALGLAAGGVEPRGRYDVVLILGGLARACISRPLYTARVMEKNELEVGKVVAIGAFRNLSEGEVNLFEPVAGASAGDEFEAMDRGVRKAFGLEELVATDRDDGESPYASWRVHEYRTESGTTVEVAAAPSSEPETRRANTADTLAWLAANRVDFGAAERILVVTTDIYVPFQQADALRTLGLPHGVEVEVAGVIPGLVDPRLAHVFKTHKYLQEIRSAIRSLRRLHAALTAAGEGSA